MCELYANGWPFYVKDLKTLSFSIPGGSGTNCMIRRDNSICLFIIEIGSCYVAHVGLKLATIFRPQPP